MMFLLHVLAIMRLRERPLLVALAVLGVASGVALAVSVTTLLSSLSRSIDDLGSLDGQAALEISARSPLGMSEDLVDIARRDPGVQRATPQLRQPLIVDGQQVILIGREDVPGPLAGRALINPAEGEQLVSIGSVDGPQPLTVRPASGTAAELNAGRVVLLPLGLAQEVSDRVGMVDSIAIDVVADDAEGLAGRLETQLGSSVDVVSADALRGYALNQIEQVQQPVILMAGIALVAGAAMVFNTVQSSARQRSRELAILRAVGGTKTQVASGLVSEAAVIGLAGSVVGLVGGLALARGVVAALPAVVSTAAGTEISFHADAGVIPLSLIAGLGTALLASIVPIRRVLRSKPNQVLHRHPPSRQVGTSRSVGLTVLIGSGLALAGLAMSASTSLEIAQNALVILLAGLLIAGYGLARWIGAASSAIARRSGHLGSLAQARTADDTRRVWAVAAAVFTAVALAITVGASARNQVATSQGHLRLTQDTAVWVSTAGSDDLPVGFFFPTGLAEELRAIDGVESVTAETISYAVRDERRYVLMGVDGPASYPVFALAGDEVMAEVARGDGAVITTQYAREFQLDVGDVVTIDGAIRDIELPVLAVTRTVSVSNYGTVTIGRDHFVDAFGDPGATGFQVFADPNGDRDNAEILAAADLVMRDGVNGSVPVVTGTGQQWFDDAEAVYREIANVFLVILAGIVGLAGLATLNATASSVVERSRQLGVLRALGATGAQVRRLVITEAASAGLVGAVLGVVVGSFGHWVGVRVTNNASPFPTDYAFSVLTTGQALVAGSVAVVLGALVPAHRIARAHIGTAMAYE